MIRLETDLIIIYCYSIRTWKFVFLLFFFHSKLSKTISNKIRFNSKFKINMKNFLVEMIHFETNVSFNRFSMLFNFDWIEHSMRANKQNKNLEFMYWTTPHTHWILYKCTVHMKHTHTRKQKTIQSKPKIHV